MIEDRGHLASPDEVRFFPAAAEALARLRARFVFFIVTNQPGIAKGILTREQVDRVNSHVISRLACVGVTIAEAYVCPHRREEGCPCIKPNPYFLARAAADHRIDLRESFVVGDHPHDVQLARNAGAVGVYVRTGHGEQHLSELPPGEIVVLDIAEAAEWILARSRSSPGTA